jgi:hypothetical protein
MLLAVASLATCDRSCAGESASTTTTLEAAAPPTRIGSCDRVASVSVCSEYTGAYLSQNEASITSSCKRLGGSFAYAECQNTVVLGSCRLPTTEVRKFYGSGATPYDAAGAQKECDVLFGGTWSAFH